MVKLIETQALSRELRTGQFSDGSDLAVATQTVWIIHAIDDDGFERVLEFDHDPTAQELVDALPPATPVVPTSKARLEHHLERPYEIWQRWKTTREEAQARGAAPAVITALQNNEDASWAEYAAAINTWRTAE